jgi:hypothetical protein
MLHELPVLGGHTVVQVMSGIILKCQLSLSLMLRPTVSRLVCLGIKHTSGAYDQIFFFCRRTVAGLLIWGALSDERTGLSFTIASGPSQRINVN